MGRLVRARWDMSFQRLSGEEGTMPARPYALCAAACRDEGVVGSVPLTTSFNYTKHKIG